MTVDKGKYTQALVENGIYPNIKSALNEAKRFNNKANKGLVEPLKCAIGITPVEHICDEESAKSGFGMHNKISNKICDRCGKIPNQKFCEDWFTCENNDGNIIGREDEQLLKDFVKKL